MSTTAMDTGRILVVDDAEEERRLLVRLLTSHGYTVEVAGDGPAAIAAVTAFSPDVVLLDVEMPGMSGFEVCKILKGDRATRLIPVVIVTGLGEREDKIEGINAGADDFMTKPVNPHELRARVKSLVRLKRFTDDLDWAQSVILSLALTIEARDPYTGGHCERVASYAAALGVHMDLPLEDLSALHRSGYLHDVGKVAVPDAVLTKDGRLTPEEFDLIKQHPVVGEALCCELRALRAVRPIVRSHHERLDGSGYPDGLRGDAVPLLAQVLSIADAYDAMTTTRSYRAAMPATDALQALTDEVKKGWRRADLVDAFMDLAAHGRLERLAIIDPAISHVRPLASVV